MNKLEKAFFDLQRPIAVKEIIDAPQCTRVRIQPMRRTLASGKPGAMTTIANIKSRLNDVAAMIETSHISVTHDRSGIWLEVQKPQPDIVRFRDVALPDSARNNNALNLVLGKSTHGNIVSVNLASPRTAHVLVAGTTGSGKSILLHGMIASLCHYTNPCHVQIILIDTHSHMGSDDVSINDGLGAWANCAHVREIANTASRALTLLQATSNMVRERYTKSNDYTKSARRGSHTPNSQTLNSQTETRYVFFIDELAELLDDPTFGSRIHTELKYLLASARKKGVHIVAATQYPAAETVRGVLKANFPARVAMTVASAVESRVAIGRAGAERLGGKGDGLLRIGIDVTRFQGVLVDDRDLRAAQKKSPQEKGPIAGEKVKKGVPKKGLGRGIVRRLMDASRKGGTEMNNEQLRKMAKLALEHWDFDNETDPTGAIKRGLEYLASPGDYEQEVISSRVKNENDWDGLEEWALYLGTPASR